MEGEIPRELVLESGMPTSTSCAREAFTSRWRGFLQFSETGFTLYTSQDTLRLWASGFGLEPLHFTKHSGFGLQASDLSLCTSEDTSTSRFTF